MIRSVLGLLLNQRKGNAWVFFGILLAAIIIGVAVVIAVGIYTTNQTHPFWEVRG